MREGPRESKGPQEQYREKKKLIDGLFYLLVMKYNSPETDQLNKEWSMMVSQYMSGIKTLAETLPDAQRLYEKLRDIALEIVSDKEEISERNLEFYAILDKQDTEAEDEEKEITEH